MIAESDAIIKARELLQTTRHAAMATINVDGTPHNTPFFLSYNPQFTKTIGAHIQNHNIHRIYNAQVRHLLLYMIQNMLN